MQHDYKMVASKEGTRITGINQPKHIKSQQKQSMDNFKNIYTAPWIITTISENREYDRVSDTM